MASNKLSCQNSLMEQKKKTFKTEIHIKNPETRLFKRENYAYDTNRIAENGLNFDTEKLRQQAQK